MTGRLKLKVGEHGHQRFEAGLRALWACVRYTGPSFTRPPLLTGSCVLPGAATVRGQRVCCRRRVGPDPDATGASGLWVKTSSVLTWVARRGGLLA